MKKIVYIFMFFFFSFSVTFASSGDSVDAGILEGGKSIEGFNLKTGDVHMEHIPAIILGAIDYLMYFSVTIAMIFIIVGAYQILFGSLSQDKTKGKTTILLAIAGFVLASMAWIILRAIVDNFS